MRGRTNITQRTGPSVIGNLVTRKQVTGSRIESGDFVEFTGNTTDYKRLLGPFTFGGCGCFKINNTIYGAVYVNSSNQCKCVIFNDSEVLRDTTLSDIPIKPESKVSYVTFESNKIYVSIYKDGIFVFNLNTTNYAFTYSNHITIAMATQDGYHDCVVKNGYIYFWNMVVDTTGSPPFVCTFYKLSMNGSTIITTIESVRVSDVPALKLTDNYLILVWNILCRKSVNLNTNYISDTWDESLLIFNSGSVFECDDLFFSIGWYKYNTSSYTLYLEIFYLDSNGIAHVLKSPNVFPRIESPYNNSSDYIYVRNNSGDYEIIVMDLTSVYEQMRMTIFLYKYDSANVVVSQKDQLVKTYNYPDAPNSPNQYELLTVYLDGTYHVFISVNTKDNVYNYLYEMVFSVVDWKIEFVESLDLVKKYQNRIDGVAKIGGNAGEEISVYIP